MRANINIDKDAYQFASAYAGARGIALGAAVSELLREQEARLSDTPSSSSRVRFNEHGLLVKAKTGRVIASDQAREYAEDDPA